ncbi:sensor histidine kinase [Microbacterium oxydans]|uniref:sensor histidine kinase n=1 Tax=Microbacterium oxydans TaxID=82380 RepID=UPI00226B7EC7|nr:histidine kinase [Microbacterium oxydans]WAA64500.1 histidine kinase [Microbacterium oxydans]
MPAPGAQGIAAALRSVIVFAVVVTFAVLPFPAEDFRATGWLLVPALLPAAAVLVRRRAPFVALGASLFCAIVLAFAGVVSPSALLAAAFSCYTLVDLRGRLVGAAGVVAAAVVVFFSNGLAMDGDLFDSAALQFVLFLLLAGALGDAARSRREFVAVMTERAERAEQSRDDEARRRVMEERVRIARDLHDVVAHQISVISLNAGVASSAVESRPERAREALTTIRSASRTVLTDIGGLMSLLRADDGDDPSDLRPQHGLADLDALIERFEEVGLRVDLRREDDTVAMSPASDHVAYLVVQEGLTNAHKHGAQGRVAVTVRAVDEALALTVANPVDPSVVRSSPSGHGLRGLRERVSAVRGEVAVESTGEDFVLSVHLPTNGRSIRA